MAPSKSKQPAKAAVPTKEEKSADLVMGTNNSSIVSKRSVEMLYYPEPHFFRYFVKKPQRRAPLINRGYWLRMHAMEESVRRFMREPSDKPKFVLNLGCGFDPLPFILLSADRSLCSQTTFVDIDYEKLMLNKKAALREAGALTQILENVEFASDESAVQIRSGQYVAVGCDLKNLDKLDRVLKTEVLPADCSVLFLAEVSLTYMDVKSANAVVKWASKLSNDAQFCILEQFFPDGSNHPFASTMMKHFGKLGAPLYSIHEYPSLTDQERRFTEAGWTHAHARSLWDLWSDDEFVSSALRTSLDSVESFDEWEEFALFASHYFLLHASTRPGTADVKRTATNGGPSHQVVNKSDGFRLVPNTSPPTGQRRFGALVPGSEGAVGIHSGWGRQTRVADTDLYAPSKEGTGSHAPFPPSNEISARLCHTITTFNDSGDCLLVGGRTSPASALHDTWVRRNNAWQASASLPVGRFRHCATRVTLDTGSEDGSSSVLVYGGKTSHGTTLDAWLLWSDVDNGWKTVTVQTKNDRTAPKARFGACLANVNNTSGVLFGGVGADGTILEDFWTWSLYKQADGSVCVELTDQTESIKTLSSCYDLLPRFGATVASTSRGLVVAGGIIPRRIVPCDSEILLLDSAVLLKCIESGYPIGAPVLSTIGLSPAYSGPRPLLVGHVSHAASPNQILLLGGGAVCFSFGTFWTEGTWLLSPADKQDQIENNWALVRSNDEQSTQEKAAAEKPAKTKKQQQATKKHKPKHYKSTTKVAPIPRVSVNSAAEFQQILDDARPVIIEGADIGPCTERWTKEYLVDTVGADRKVIVHAASSETMSFQTKNFKYEAKPFGTFMDEVHAGGRQYLRSISEKQPAKLPANLAADFPSLGGDFRLPEALKTVVENAHSSPLRISGPVTLWLHYDVMANVLCQIQGEKRLILYPPSDVQHLDVPAGASSSNINVFQNRADGAIAMIPRTSPHEARMKRGDILFIPPLWLHTAAPTGEVSVAVNVFFRNLSQGYALGRDVYGNRDVQAYEKGRKDLEKMVKSFGGLPPDMARFYLLRLADELQEMAEQ
ncbi:tRNA methyltransferase PPM2 [Aspergillus mulundensis]|uniref:tRNA wybutosine-synthesizing protein 4 n=1 Tax=Aspergillus mulundensis TaxID=1810919 RepID=A0A3D8QML5_9EURO|nr:tRNA wybutosine-synthesizing protein 4 [Aspergillus mulundensis]RDW62938.1 tRNA wybutosine-synthesizing protein 4 [Aspergillus mulundensis]